MLDFVGRADTMTQDLKSGAIDAAYGVPPAQYDQVAKLDGFQGFRDNLHTWDYVCFNCYDQPSSLGHPVFKDVKFRQALNWAVDKERLVAIGWNGCARPTTTIMLPGEWPAGFNAHYEPTAEEAYGFDIAKANQLLEEAGYTDSNGDGIREYEGKNIKLRLMARTQSAESQSEGKLVAGWFKQCGLDIKYSVIEDGALSDALYDYDASRAYASDYDIYLCEEQFSQIDKTARLDTIHRLQQIFYDESPQIAMTYPDTLEVANTAKREGWVPFLDGLPFLNAFNMDTYLNLKPKAATESGSGSSSTATLIIVGVAAAPPAAPGFINGVD